ncbi:MAG TPA: zinc ribbon domain-containing protein [Gemmatimonadales bacterium]|nr:zinc ribbon domain-containing protein [Gemmatimonadales bacterium]
MFELIVGALLAAGATYYVLLPILRPPAPTPTGAAASWGTDEGDDPDDDMSPQTVALRALKEIEFDRATGKLSDADYAALKAKYTEEALAVLRGTPRPKSAPRSPLPAPACPTDGPRPEPDAVFCSACGRRLGTAPAYCARCGTALEKDSRYCDRCGARVAA